MDNNANANVNANIGPIIQNSESHWDKPLVRSIISAPNGSGSTSRTGVLLIVVASILWVSYYLVVHKVFPDFSSLTMWDSAMITLLYGSSKFSETMANLKNRPNGL